MTDGDNWVDDVKHQKRPVSPWTALGWLAFTLGLLVLPAAVLAGWRALL